MAKVSSQQFLRLAQRSQLLAQDSLTQEVARIQARFDGRLPATAEELAQALVEADVLTQWQCGKLLEGKCRGFFLGKYRLRDLLGSGGMSTVYLADHVRMNRRVAIKVLPRSRIDAASYLDRFYREAQAVAALDHPNIVRAYDVDCEEDTHYLVMEYVAGSNLRDLVLGRDEPLGLHSMASYIMQAAKGLHYAHEAGLIHRDVKPANLLVDQRGHVKILDLGLARFSAQEVSSLTVANQENLLGTADYLAPEQALNSHEVDARADIYSLGCTFFFALTGRPPFPEGTLAQRIAQHQSAEPPPILELRSDCPAELAAICQQMMLKAPAERPQDCEAVADALHRWLEDSLASVASQAAPPRVPQMSKIGKNPRPRAVIKADKSVAPPIQTARAPNVADNDSCLSLDVSATSSLVENRRIRRTGSVKRPPPMLWITMALLTLVAIFLFVLLLLSR